VGKTTVAVRIATELARTGARVLLTTTDPAAHVEAAAHERPATLRVARIDPEVETEVHSYPVQAGDIYLMCSDGLNDMVTDEDIQATLSSFQANLPLAAKQLVQQACDNGGRDNVSVILVRIVKAFPARTGLMGKLKTWFS